MGAPGHGSAVRRRGKRFNLFWSVSTTAKPRKGLEDSGAVTLRAMKTRLIPQTTFLDSCRVDRAVSRRLFPACTAISVRAKGCDGPVSVATYLCLGYSRPLFSSERLVSHHSISSTVPTEDRGICHCSVTTSYLAKCLSVFFSIASSRCSAQQQPPTYGVLNPMTSHNGIYCLCGAYIRRAPAVQRPES